MLSEVAIPQPAAAQPVDTETTVEPQSEKNKVPETPMVTTVATAGTSVVAAITAPIVSLEAGQTKHMDKNEDMFGLTQSQEEEDLRQIEQVQENEKEEIAIQEKELEKLSISKPLSQTPIVRNVAAQRRRVPLEKMQSFQSENLGTVMNKRHNVDDKLYGDRNVKGRFDDGQDRVDNG